MEIFSAQNTENKEFSLIEFRSELEALPLLNSLPDHVKIIDLFSLLNGHFVAFISCNDLKKTFENLRANSSVVGTYFTGDKIVETLNAFYYLNKASISDSVVALETDKFYKLFEIINAGLRSELQVLDIKNQRSFSKNTLYLTGSSSAAKKFTESLKKDSDIKPILLYSVSENLKTFF